MPRRTLHEHMSAIKDPRISRTKKHRLDDIPIITLCAVLCRATSFEDIAELAEVRESWLKKFLKLPNGIPSHGTIYRVLCALDRKVFAECFGRWVSEWSEVIGIEQVAIDGKSLRHAKGNTFSGCMHLVGAWATEAGLLLGQEAVEARSSEATAIPALLEILHLKGSLVTIDAGGCSPENCRKIRDQKGDYLIAVKANQPKLHNAVMQVFADACEADFKNVAYTQHETIEDKHGRHEERYVTVIENPQGLPENWPDVGSVVQVNREREVKGKNTSTTHYFLTSLNADAKTIGRYIRRHWAIENELHWSLDVTYGEDAHRTANKNAAANLAAIRRTSISMLKQDITSKRSLRGRSYKASISLEYMEQILLKNTVI